MNNAYLLPQVTYDSNVSVDLGNVLTPTQVIQKSRLLQAFKPHYIYLLHQVQNAPTVAWPVEDSADLYTLIMTGG